MGDINEMLCELLGICWHEQVDDQTLQCKHCGAPMLFPWQQSPDFTSDARLVLREMRKIGKLARFLSWLNAFSFDEDGDMIDNAVPVEFIINTTGLLADKALEFLERKEASHED